LSNPAALALVNNLTLITGGARSGKSAFAEKLALAQAGKVTYIATMEEVATDAESAQRIARHRQRRSQYWRTVEVPFDIHKDLARIIEGSEVCLIDCLSLYVSNLLLRDGEAVSQIKDLEESISSSATQLLQAINELEATQFIVVTNEVGWGIVPENGLARAYRDLLGLTNQQFAACAQAVWLCCAGLPVRLKPAMT